MTIDNRQRSKVNGQFSTFNFQLSMKKILLLLYAVLLITLFSACSFLYPLNPWDDANVYMTIGNAMLVGFLPCTNR